MPSDGGCARQIRRAPRARTLLGSRAFGRRDLIPRSGSDLAGVRGLAKGARVAEGLPGRGDRAPDHPAIDRPRGLGSSVSRRASSRSARGVNRPPSRRVPRDVLRVAPARLLRRGLDPSATRARAAERAGGLATTSDRAGTPPFASFAAPIFHRQDDARGPAPPRASGPRTPPSPARANHPAFAAHSPGEDKLFYGHMVAGALAGTTEHTAMFPLDTIKTRMQTASRVIPNPAVAAATKASPGGGGLGRPSLGTTLLAPPRYVSSSMRSAASSLLRAEGVAGLYRGVAAVAAGAGPAHAVYFATYEKVKASAMARRKRVSEGDAPPTVLDDVSPEVLYAFAGACATIVGDAVQTPVDTIKQRLQMSDSPYKGVWDCARRTVREQGPGALYRSCPTTLAMNVPFTAIHFSAYESSKRFLGERLRLEGGEMEEESFLTQFTAGGFAGGLAAACTTPLDVVKTRMQTHCELAECPEMTNVKKRTLSQFAAPAGTPSPPRRIRRRFRRRPGRRGAR